MIELHEFPVEVDGLTLQGHAFVPPGSRGAIALLHGIPSTSPPDPDDEGYKGFASRFAHRGWTSVWADMRAARDSPGYFSIEGWVEDAAAIIDTARVLAASPPVVIASSAGGVVALEAIRRGTKCAAAVLLATPAEWLSFAGDPRAGVERIQLGSGMALSPETLADPASWAAEFEEVSGEKAIAAVDVPVLIVHGTADEVVPVEHSYRLEAAAPSSERFLIQGGEHQLRRDPEAVDRVMEWIERIEV